MKLGNPVYRRSNVPWLIADSDLRPISAELVRDTATEHQVGLVVYGQAPSHPVLGLIAIRCRRHGAQIEPMTLSIPDTPSVQP